MSILGKILKTGFDVLALPVEVVKDVATCASAVTDTEGPYTWRRLKQIAQDAGEVKDQLEKL